MKTLLQVGSIIAITLALGCATKVLDYEGATVQHGAGGAKETIDGIDFWKVGTPNGDYKIVGIVEDEYFDNGSPLGSLLAGNAARSRIVKAAKQKGANGVIFISKDRSGMGIYGQVDGTGNFHANQKSKVAQQAALIQYVR